jgi:TetR/AcrR family transcriptional repressor of lmrAB and yxaGH operons
MDSSRQRIVETTARLLWSQGLRATGVNQIAAESKAPRGSIYFHFPGGKEQLAAEALRAAGASMTANIEEALTHRSATTAIRRFVDSYAREMRDSDFHHGCPVATVALEASTTSPLLREVCARIFGEWEDLLERRLVRDGLKPREARRFAGVILSALEGAMIVSRARRDTEPLEWVAQHLTAALALVKRARR